MLVLIICAFFFGRGCFLTQRYLTGPSLMVLEES